MKASFAAAPLSFRILVFLALFAGASVLSPGNLPAADQENCMKCHRYPGLGAVEEDGARRTFYVDEERHRLSIHGRILCGSCHSDVKQIPHKAANRVDCGNECHVVEPSTKKVFTHRRVIEEFSRSVHGKRKPGLESDYPTCISCHQNTMYVAKIMGARSAGIQRCRACHEDERWGDRFFNHFFLRMDESRSSKEIVALCGGCHEDSRMMARHGLETTRDLKGTIHWEAIKYDSPYAPNCITCHAPTAIGKYTIHSIRPFKDPASPFYDRETRRKICAQEGCHSTATEEFAAGRVHAAASKVGVLAELAVSDAKTAFLGAPVDRRVRVGKSEADRLEGTVIVLIRLGYRILIGCLVGFMLFHQYLDFRIHRRTKNPGGHQERDHPPAGGEHGGRSVFVRRLTKTQLLQHNINAVAFMVLTGTGFMALIPASSVESWFGQYAKVFYLFRGVTHRIFAGILILVSSWHLVYVAATKEGREFFRDMLPRGKDGKDMLAFFRHAFGKSPAPRCDRFDYREKMEYITGALGTVIVTVSGFCLMFSGIFPLYVAKIGALVHIMEAILANLAISVWHMYAVHVKPGKFPGSTAYIDGMLPLHEIEEEHPVYYQKAIEPRLHDGDTAGGLIEYREEQRPLDRIAKGPAMKAAGVGMIMFLIVFDVFLVWALYFKEIDVVPDKAAAGTADIDPSRIRKSAFHRSPLRAAPIRKPTVCTPCHGGMAHSKKSDVRAMLNMHSDFMACAVCHVRLQDLDPGARASWKVDWYNDATGERVTKFSPKTGVYDIEMAPTILREGRRVRIDQQLEPEQANKEREKWAKMTLGSPAIALAARKAHGSISKQSITCQECHRQRSPYLDFAALGYPKNWVDELTGPKVTGLLTGYSTFYMPSMFSPEAIRQEREKRMREHRRGGK
jgi:cytochrome b subunit of formate dehydrogenase